MSRLPLDQVDAFVTAARLRNLTRAAEAMHLTVSALSHRMRLLEQRLGHKLLARGPRGVELTPDGQRLFDAISGPLGGQQRDRHAQAPRAQPLHRVLMSHLARRIVHMVRALFRCLRGLDGMHHMALQEQHALAHSAQLLPPLLPGSGLHGTAPWRRCPA